MALALVANHHMSRIGTSFQTFIFVDLTMYECPGVDGSRALIKLLETISVESNKFCAATLISLQSGVYLILLGGRKSLNHNDFGVRSKRIFSGDSIECHELLFRDGRPEDILSSSEVSNLVYSVRESCYGKASFKATRMVPKGSPKGESTSSAIEDEVSFIESERNRRTSDIEKQQQGLAMSQDEFVKLIRRTVKAELRSYHERVVDRLLTGQPTFSHMVEEPGRLGIPLGQERLWYKEASAPQPTAVAKAGVQSNRTVTIGQGSQGSEQPSVVNTEQRIRKANKIPANVRRGYEQSVNGAVRDLFNLISELQEFLTSTEIARLGDAVARWCFYTCIQGIAGLAIYTRPYPGFVPHRDTTSR